MAQDLRIELPEFCNFITTRTAFSELWFINNKDLENQILGILAKYQTLYSVILYSFIIMGNHIHLEATFPKANRAQFMRSFNSMVARLVNRIVKKRPNGPVWARRYSNQVVPNHDDIENRFFYTALNPIASGLAKDLRQFNGYCSFFDSIRDTQRVFPVVDWRKYDDKKRFNEDLTPEDFTTDYTLVYSRLPGYEHLSQAEYEQAMLERLHERQKEAVEKRIGEGKGFADPKKLRKQVPGSRPRTTKTSSRNSKRPLVLTSCAKTRQWFLDLYFAVRNAYTEAYEALKKNPTDIIEFPPGTYRPIHLHPS